MTKNGEVRITLEESDLKTLNVVGKEEGKTNDPTVAADWTQRLPKVFEKKLQKLKATRDSLNSIGLKSHGPQGKPKIGKVPLLVVREHDPAFNTQYYKPRVVSIGPIHHGREEQYELGEEHKLKLTVKFVDASGKSEATLLERVLREIAELKKCFDEEDEEVIRPPYDDNEELAWMLFVDGCAVLQAIHVVGSKGSFGALKIKGDLMAFAQQDLFLLENQLPYRLLEILMNESAEKEKLKISIQNFITKHSGVDCYATVGSTDGETSPNHLLDLLRTRILGIDSSGAPIDRHENRKPEASDNPNKERYVQDQQYSFCNVQELKAAGIHVRRSEKVNDSTGPKFLNLIAYEMCPDFNNDFGVTSYISFLDSLINHPEDVAELRKEGILHNLLGSDEEVARLFNQIGTDLPPEMIPEHAKAKEDVRRDLEKLYKKKCMTWIAELFHKHFSSPWTIMALLGALLGLGLTAIQTWYTVKST